MSSPTPFPTIPIPGLPELQTLQHFPKFLFQFSQSFKPLQFLVFPAFLGLPELQTHTVLCFSKFSRSPKTSNHYNSKFFQGFQSPSASNHYNSLFFQVFQVSQSFKPLQFLVFPGFPSLWQP